MAKGIKKAVIKKDMQHHGYNFVLLTIKQMDYKMKSSRIVNYELGSYEINKTSLSCDCTTTSAITAGRWDI